MEKLLAIMGLVLVTVIWGGGFVASDVALESFRPYQIMAVRFFLATALMGGISVKSLKGIRKEELKAGFLMGCALFTGFAMQIVGLMYTTPSKNAFLTATNVVMVPFIALVVYRKRIRPAGLFGAVMAIAGVGILSLNQDFSLGAGDALTLVGAVGFAFQIFLTSEYVTKYRAAVLNLIQMGTAFVFSMFFMAITGQWRFSVTGEGVGSVLYLGVVSTTITYLLQTTCQKYVDETKAAIILSMESVFGTLFSIWLLHEKVTFKMVIGCVLILAAVLISNLAEGKKEET